MAIFPVLLSSHGHCGPSSITNDPPRTSEPRLSLTCKRILTSNLRSFIHWSALAFSILSLVWVLKATYGVYVKSTHGRIALADEERGPLLGR